MITINRNSFEINGAFSGTETSARATLRDGWPNASVHFGFDSRSGKHRKTTISFAR